MNAPRLFVAAPLVAGAGFVLDDAAARHVQVLRLQPGDAVALFDGRGGQWRARIEQIGRREVRAEVQVHEAVERELPVAVTLALIVPAGERMDFVIEKATELGAVAVVPLTGVRSVLRLAGERAERRTAHWQAIARAACEQCGRNRVPRIEAPRALPAWLASLPPPAADEARWLLGWADAALAWRDAAATARAQVTLLSGPEGGLADDEIALAHAGGFLTVNLGDRVLRADTAPLAALAALALASGA